MKRELKLEMPQPAYGTIDSIAEPIPMKRELKHDCDSYTHFRSPQHCRAYPDEKGIETNVFGRAYSGSGSIAEPIPMKRELKLA